MNMQHRQLDRAPGAPAPLGLGDYNARRNLSKDARPHRSTRLIKSLCILSISLIVACQPSPKQTPSTQPADNDNSANNKSNKPTPTANATSIPSDDWSMYRGHPQLTGVAESTLAPPLTQRWRVSPAQGETVAFVATAAIVDDRVYIGHDFGTFYALDLSDGSVVWQFDETDEAAINSSALVHDGKVYFGDGYGVMYCLAADSGKLLWNFDSKNEIVSSPNLTPDGLIVFGSTGGSIYALKADSGEKVWEYRTEDQVQGTVGIADGVCLIGGCDGRLHVIDAKTGEGRRKMPIDGQTGGAVAISGTSAFLGTFGNEVLGFDWADGKVRWRYRDEEREFPFFSSASIADGTVYIGGRDKRLHAINAATGERRWVFQARAKIDSSPVISGPLVYVGSHDGRLYAVNRESGARTWYFEVGSPISASPAIARGVLVVGTEDGAIYCLEPGKT